MIKLGYKNNDFNQLSESINQDNCSSQEVLLAAAWIISTQDLMNLFLSNKNSFFEQEYFKDLSRIQIELDHLEREKDYLTSENEKTKSNSVLQLNYLKRLEHVFISKLNSLNSCLKEKSKLTCEVRKKLIFLKFIFLNQNFLDSSRNTI
jgi:hypothetical protein